MLLFKYHLNFVLGSNKQRKYSINTFVANVSIFEEKKGGLRVDIWYKIHPTAQMSAFSP